MGVVAGVQERLGKGPGAGKRSHLSLQHTGTSICLHDGVQPPAAVMGVVRVAVCEASADQWSSQEAHSPCHARQAAAAFAAGRGAAGRVVGATDSWVRPQYGRQVGQQSAWRCCHRQQQQQQQHCPGVDGCGGWHGGGCLCGLLHRAGQPRCHGSPGRPSRPWYYALSQEQSHELRWIHHLNTHTSVHIPLPQAQSRPMPTFCSSAAGTHASLTRCCDGSW